MTASHDLRRQPDLYWREMEQIKAASLCIRLYRNQLSKRVRAVDLVKAIASSGGIAGWVIWRDYPFVWSLIIVAAQFLDAIKHVFPFAQQHKAASDMTVALELIFIDMQHEWERIYATEMSQSEIMDARRRIQRLQVEAERQHFPEGFEPPARLAALAAREARVYMSTTYRETSAREQE